MNRTSSNKHTIYIIFLILFLLGTVCVFSALLANTIIAKKELNRLYNIENNIDLIDSNYDMLHSQFISCMSCNITDISRLYTVYSNMYHDASLDVGRDNNDLWHIYSPRKQQTLGKIVTLISKRSELYLENSIVTCHGGHIITLQDNMNIIISGITPLKLMANVPLISYNISQVYSKMIYKNNI